MTKVAAESPGIVASQYSRLVPSAYRIGAISGTSHRTEFAIVERRLCVSWLQNDDWADPEQREPGVTIARFVFYAFEGRLRQRGTPLCNVSLHALARFHERRPHPPQAALWGDLMQLADAGEEGDRVDTTAGFWLGRTIVAEGDGGRVIRLRSVRTWLAN